MILDPNIRSNLETLIETMAGYGGTPPAGVAQNALRNIVLMLGGNADVVEQGPPEYVIAYALALVIARG